MKETSHRTKCAAINSGKPAAIPQDRWKRDDGRILSVPHWPTPVRELATKHSLRDFILMRNPRIDAPKPHHPPPPPRAAQGLRSISSTSRMIPQPFSTKPHARFPGKFQRGIISSIQKHHRDKNNLTSDATGQICQQKQASLGGPWFVCDFRGRIRFNLLVRNIQRNTFHL